MKTNDHSHQSGRVGIYFALAAALLFGAGTPFSKVLLGSNEPIVLAALLYLGSGVGLSLWCGRDAQGQTVTLKKRV